MARMTKPLIFRNLSNRSQTTVIKSIDWKVEEIDDVINTAF